MRQQDFSPGEALTRNAQPSLTRNAEALQILDDASLAHLVDALLPLLLYRINDRQEPSRNGAAVETILCGESTDTNRGVWTGQETQRDRSPVFHVQEVPTVVGPINVDRFYGDMLQALEAHAIRGGTAFGAAAIIKRVAKDYGLAVADRIPLPRPTRAEREQLAWERQSAGKS